MSDWNEVLRTVSVKREATLLLPRVRLVVTAGKDAGTTLDFDRRARIGARRLADLVLRDAKVSGLHCEVTAGDEVRVRDLGSKNGTYLGGFRVIEAVVPLGETISVGDTRVRVVPLDDSVEVNLHPDDQFHGVIGRSAMMRALLSQIERVADSNATVLIQGETGTGKERVAEALHLGSKRAAGPLVIVDCGSLPANLIEGELFGHERGAYTGAVTSMAGAFERAHGGTLFLDEIGELPLELQPKLLRALESRTVCRLGSARRIAVDVRIVAATNRDMALSVGRGLVREDLYYRLAVVTLHLPPLRERLEDLPLLASHLLHEMGVDPATCLSGESLAELAAYHWPGNVRELRNTLERAAALLSPVSIARPAASHGGAPPAGTFPVDLRTPLREGKRRVVEDYERAYLTAMLAECDGNTTELARRAGMDRISIYRMIRRLGLRPAGEPG
jgi:transcriptional regulator with GAF, ATPase, and Fis domain